MEQFRFARDFQIGRVGTNLDVFRPGDLAEFADVNGLEKSLVLKRQKNALPDGTGQINDAGGSIRIRNLNPVTRQGSDTIRTFHGYSVPSEGRGVKFWSGLPDKRRWQIPKHGHASTLPANNFSAIILP
jgi:hypothetical protein